MRRFLLLATCGALLAACTEDGSPPPDFDGYWQFDVTVLPGGCPGDTSGVDCFRITQTGNDLLVVDDVGGNLRGRADGREATLSRSSPEGSVLLTLTLSADGRRATGHAVEADSLRACTTEVDVSGFRRDAPCN